MKRVLLSVITVILLPVCSPVHGTIRANTATRRLNRPVTAGVQVMLERTV
ncbi:MAG: hypothetical protein R2758_08460 [Bacteroidales bacterium]